MRLNLRHVLSFVLALSLAGASGCSRRKEIWIYTSLPKDVISEMAEPLQAAVGGADVRWYQSTSENIGNRLATELENGKVKADLVVTNDPYWYQEMKQKGHLLPYESPAAKEVPAAFRDPDNAWVSVRLPVIVMAYNSNVLKPADLPEKWKDLASPRFDRKVSMSLPLDYAPGFAILSSLSKTYGWEFFADLRKHGLVAEGSHASVLTRIETGERPVGALPLDFVLRAGSHYRSIKAIYPQDGAILVPGPIAILKDARQPELARKIFDWFFSDAAQNAIVKGGTYSPFARIPAPQGAKPWAELQAHLLPWSPASLAEELSGRDRTKARFSEVVLH